MSSTEKPEFIIQKVPKKYKVNSFYKKMIPFFIRRDIVERYDIIDLPESPTVEFSMRDNFYPKKNLGVTTTLHQPYLNEQSIFRFKKDYYLFFLKTFSKNWSAFNLNYVDSIIIRGGRRTLVINWKNAPIFMNSKRPPKFVNRKNFDKVIRFRAEYQRISNKRVRIKTRSIFVSSHVRLFVRKIKSSVSGKSLTVGGEMRTGENSLEVLNPEEISHFDSIEIAKENNDDRIIGEYLLEKTLEAIHPPDVYEKKIRDYNHILGVDYNDNSSAIVSYEHSHYVRNDDTKYKVQLIDYETDAVLETVEAESEYQYEIIIKGLEKGKAYRIRSFFLENGKRRLESEFTFYQHINKGIVRSDTNIILQSLKHVKIFCDSQSDSKLRFRFVHPLFSTDDISNIIVSIKNENYQNEKQFLTSKLEDQYFIEFDNLVEDTNYEIEVSIFILGIKLSITKFTKFTSKKISISDTEVQKNRKIATNIIRKNLDNESIESIELMTLATLLETAKKSLKEKIKPENYGYANDLNKNNKRRSVFVKKKSGVDRVNQSIIMKSILDDSHTFIDDIDTGYLD